MKRFLLHQNKQQRAVSAKVERTLIMCCCCCFFCCFFCWRVFMSCQGYFCLLGGVCSAHKHHCLQALLTASQESLWSTGSTLTALARRPIHPHRLGSTHTLSVSQRHSQWHQRGQLGGPGMSWIKFLLATERKSLLLLPFSIIYALLGVSVSSLQQLKALPCEIKTFPQSLPGSCFAKFLLYYNICSQNNETCCSFIKKIPRGSQYYADYPYPGKCKVAV